MSQFPKERGIGLDITISTLNACIIIVMDGVGVGVAPAHKAHPFTLSDPIIYCEYPSINTLSRLSSSSLFTCYVFLQGGLGYKFMHMVITITFIYVYIQFVTFLEYMPMTLI